MTNKHIHIGSKDASVEPRDEDTREIVLELTPYGHFVVKEGNT